MKIDLFVRAVREPKKTKLKNKKGQQRYISRICGVGTPKDGELKLGTFVEPMNIINPTNFYLFLMNSFRASGVKNEDLPLKGIWLLQHCLALPRWHVIAGDVSGGRGLIAGATSSLIFSLIILVVWSNIISLTALGNGLVAGILN
jgi:hypothetical protein